MGNKISKGPKSINTGTKFPQGLGNLTPSTLLPLFPRSCIPSLQPVFSPCVWEYLALGFNLCFTKYTAHTTTSGGESIFDFKKAKRHGCARINVASTREHFWASYCICVYSSSISVHASGVKRGGGERRASPQGTTQAAQAYPKGAEIMD